MILVVTYNAYMKPMMLSLNGREEQDGAKTSEPRKSRSIFGLTSYAKEMFLSRRSFCSSSIQQGFSAINAHLFYRFK